MPVPPPPEPRPAFREDGRVDLVVPAELVGRLAAAVRVAGNEAQREGRRLDAADQALLRGVRAAVDLDRGVSACGHIAGRGAGDPRPWATSLEYAEQVMVTARTVRRWAASGQLPGARRSGRDWLIPRATRPPSAGARL